MALPPHYNSEDDNSDDENSVYNPLGHLTQSTVLYSTYLTDCFYAGKCLLKIHLYKTHPYQDIPLYWDS